MTSLQVTYHQDPGHGWIEVPMSEVRRLGIAPKISEYSYRKGEKAYLEEDCDASLFVDAAKRAGVDVLPIDRHSSVNSFIRRLPRFTV